MSTAFPKDQAIENARTWANENNAPFTVYRDEAGNYLATKTSHYNNNRTILFSGSTEIKAYQPGENSSAAPEPDETLKRAKFLMCGNSETGGRTIYGRPFILSEEELTEERRKAKEATDGTWEIIILHEQIVTLDD